MLAIALVIVGAMFYFPTSRVEKAILATVIFAVLTLEMVNIVIERLLDFIHPRTPRRSKNYQRFDRGNRFNRQLRSCDNRCYYILAISISYQVYKVESS